MAHYELTIECTFNAAHFLRRYEGKCKHLHGHSYRVIAKVIGEKLNEQSMLVDFGELKRALHDVCEAFDHKLLNDLPEFEVSNPTAERLAEVIFQRLAPQVKGASLESITVCENPGSCATYRS